MKINHLGEGFAMSFDSQHWLLKYTSWYANHIRLRRNILYLDHCLFAHRTYIQEIGGFPLYDIFEDTHLCLKLRKLSSCHFTSFYGPNILDSISKKWYILPNFNEPSS